MPEPCCDEALLSDFGLSKFAEFRITNDGRSDLDFTDDAVAALSCSIYAWLIDGEVVRIGCCKSSLRDRITSASRWLEGRILEPGKPRSRDGERWKRQLSDAARWKERLCCTGKFAEVWGRQGTTIDTPLGTINAYLAEENALLQRFRPPLNNSHHR